MKIRSYSYFKFMDIRGSRPGLNMQTEQDSPQRVVCEVSVEIKNADGLHMRPAMQFVDIANQFDCDINVSNDENTVDGKSIMQMSMLAATCGTKLNIKAEGADAREAADALRKLVVEKHFDEPMPKRKNRKNRAKNQRQ